MFLAEAMEVPLKTELSIRPLFCLAHDVANAVPSGDNHIRCQAEKQTVLDDPGPKAQLPSQFNRILNRAEITIENHVS
jgi:hypothetical protein